MRCPRCATNNNLAGAKFCGDCGARLGSICAACSSVNPLANRFCGYCGAALVPSIEAAGFASPLSYTPKYLAEKILTSREALEGERKQVTVLFADMKGSMELVADRDPEDARRLLDPVIERMMEGVHCYEGTVNQVMGDGIMALFGAPLAHEDHAVRASYAALRMQESVKRYAEEVRRREGVPIQIRIGLNSGEVVLRSIKSDLNIDYTAVGQTTHLAARMEQMAIPGSILLTADTLQLAQGYVQVNPIGSVQIKGMNQTIEAFELTGVGLARSRLQAGVARGLTRFSGRDGETEQLRKALEKAKAGHGQLVGVVGDPGIGKSRLFYEFIHSQQTQECLVLESGSVSYGKATPYFSVINLLTTYFKIQDGDDQHEIRAGVTSKLSTLGESLESTLPAVLSLLDLPVDDRLWRELDPVQRRQKILSALKRLLLRESQLQPLVLVFENLHWIDSESQQVLESILDSLPQSRLLLLVNYRSEYQHSWANRTYYTHLQLEPLPAENSREILDAILGSHRELQSVKQFLIDRTEGNPFFLEETIRTLVESRVLVGERGDYRLERHFETTQVPATVQAVLAARIDRLPLQQKHLLQSAAVIGKNIPSSLLQAITQASDEELRQGLGQLQEAEFLYETSLFPDLEYTFKHALTYEVAYGSVLHERKRAFHARIVEASETLYSNRLVEQAERLASHAIRGELWDKAVIYLRQAGIKADARSANREAVSYFNQALSALARLGDDRELRQQAIDLHFDVRNSLQALGEHEKVLENLRAAEALANGLKDERQLVRVHTYIAREHLAQSEYEEAVAACERVIAMARLLENYNQEVLATNFLGFAYDCLGNYAKAIATLRPNLTPFDGPVTNEQSRNIGLPFAFLRAHLALALAERGDFIEAITCWKEAISIAEGMGHHYSVTATYRGLGHLYLRRGNLPEATRALEHAQDLCTQADSGPLLHAVRSTVGYAYALSGRTIEAITLLEAAAERPVMMRAQQSQSLRTIWLGEAYLLAEQETKAHAAAQRALALALRNKERGCEAYSLRLLGQIASHGKLFDFPTAEHHYRCALVLAQELGMRPLIAHCHVGIGELYGRAGNLKEAKNNLARGVGMMREMEMGLWLAQAEGALNRL